MPIRWLATLALLILVAVRAVMAWRHGPPQFPGRGRSEQNIVGIPLLPTAAVRGGCFIRGAR